MSFEKTPSLVGEGGVVFIGPETKEEVHSVFRGVPVFLLLYEEWFDDVGY